MKIRSYAAIAGAVVTVLSACDKTENRATGQADAAPPSTVDAAASASAVSAPAQAADPAALKRGEYLVMVVAGCPACHTPFGPQGPDMTKLFAGGLEVPDAFGTWRSPNITQDKKTGIGGWTDEQIAAAIREGKRPNGDQLYPVMPYPLYSTLSDADVKAVVAFLRTIAPIDNAVAGNTDLKLPKPPHQKAAGAEPGPTPVAKGAYLGSLMQCPQCHTPIDEKTFMPDGSKMMAGGHKFTLPFMGTGDLYSQNITQDKKTGIGSWTDEEIGNAVTKMKHKDGKPIMGPMTGVGAGWSKLGAEDLKNLTAWLREVKPIENQVPKSTFKPHGPPPGASGSAAPAAPKK